MSNLIILQYFSATKVQLDSTDNSSDILGISAMIINDLKKRRQRDYTFDLNAAFDVNILPKCVHNYLILYSIYDLI